MEVKQERSCVRLHRPRDVEDQHELAGRLLPAAERALDGIAAGRERRPHEPADVERVTLGVAAEAARPPLRARDRDRLDQPFGTRELLGRHRSEVLRPQQLFLAPRSEARLAAVDLRARAGRGSLAALATRRRRRRLGLRLHGRAEEPGMKGAIEGVDVLATRHERLPERPVDVVLLRELDRVETIQRVGDASRPDLESRLAQHAAERDDVPDDSVSGHGRWRPDPRASRRGLQGDPRGT